MNRVGEDGFLGSIMDRNATAGLGSGAIRNSLTNLRGTNTTAGGVLGGAGGGVLAGAMWNGTSSLLGGASDEPLYERLLDRCGSKTAACVPL